jgi:hypothetical protein
VSGFLATSKIAATASVRIWCLSDPCEFGVDRANRKAAPGHGFNSPRETVFDVDTVTARTHKNVDRLEAKKRIQLCAVGKACGTNVAAELHLSVLPVIAMCNRRSMM